VEATDRLQIVNDLVKLIGGLDKADRDSILQASFAVMGEQVPSIPARSTPQTDFGLNVQSAAGPDRARLWARQHGVTDEQLSQGFHCHDGRADVIVSEMPGKTVAEKVINAYVLTGLSSLLASGEVAFSDKAARELCQTAGCYDGSNHSAYLKNKGNLFTGSKDQGWLLTTPGLKRGAELIKELPQ
jgi:hypothetical protein